MEPLTILSGEDYVLKEGITTAEAVARLGEIETLITSGELMLPDVKIGGEVFIIYKNAQVLSVHVESIFTQYDEITEKHIYHLLLRNTFYGFLVDYAITEIGTTLFTDFEDAKTALGDIELE